MLRWFARNVILRHFYQIHLSNVEREMADGALENKYVPALRQALLYSLCLVPSLLLLDTQIVVSILIPTTMVAGTAWFAVSLASMKKKFESFGLELTADLFIAFTLSLLMLFLSALASLTTDLWSPAVTGLRHSPLAKGLSALFALLVVGRLLFAIFAGSLKYDVNDAMLTGQNEAAEKFFKKSLSLLHSTAELLKSGKNLDVANYSLGLAFYEVFSDIQKRGVRAMGDVDKLVEKANELIRRPSMKEVEADTIAIELAQHFLDGCTAGAPDVKIHKSYSAIQVELECLRGNTDEHQKMKDTRLSVVFDEMSTLIEEFGPALFEAEAAT
jgi:hypothetical protein